jgi:hypothetical protein
MTTTKTKAFYSVSIPGTERRKDRYGIEYTKRNVIAFEGLVRVTDQYDWQDEEGDWHTATFRDRVLENPTWGHLLSAATRQIRKTNDEHHIFLEYAHRVGEETDDQGRTITLVRLTLGS